MLDDYINQFTAESRRTLLSLTDLPPEPELDSNADDGTGFFENLGSGFMYSPGMRGARRINRYLSVMGLNEDGRPLDPDEFFSLNEDGFLAEGIRGRHVLDRYLSGAYDGIRTEPAFMAALSADYEEAERLAILSEADGLGMVGGFAGGFLDPTNFLLAYGIPIVATTAKGAVAGQGLRTSAAAGRAISVGAPTIRESFATGSAMSIIQNAADLYMTPGEENFNEFAEQVAVDLAADSALTFGLRAASYGVNRLGKLKERIGQQNKQLAEAIAPATDAELALAAVAAQQQPPAPVKTNVADAQRQILAGMDETADVIALRRDVDRGMSQDEFSERLAFIESANDLDSRSLFETEPRTAEPVAVQQTPEAEVADVQMSRTFEPPPDPDRIDPATGRPVYDTRAAAEQAKEAEGVLFPTSETNLFDTVNRMTPEEKADAVLALSDDEVSQLNRVLDALGDSQMVPLEDFNAHVADVLEKINNRSPNLSWNPASLGAPGTVYSVKLSQPVNATVVGYTPTTNLEDLVLALKQLFGDRRSADAPPAGFAGPSVARREGGGWKATNQADEVSEKLLGFTGRARDEADLTLDFRNDGVRQAVNKYSGDRIGKENKGFIGMQSAWGVFANRIMFSKNPILSHFFGVLANADAHSKGVAEAFRLGQPIEAIAAKNRVNQTRQQSVIERSFIDFIRSAYGKGSVLSKLGQSARASNGRLSVNLMSKAERAAWDRFNNLLEVLRIGANNVRVTGGRIAWLEAQADNPRWIERFAEGDPLGFKGRYNVRDAEVEPLRKALIRILQEEQRTTSSTTVRRMAEETTTLEISPDIEFNELTQLLRGIEGHDQSVPLEKVYEPYLRLTDGKNRVIPRSDFEAALAGDTERFVRSVVRAHNERLRGIVAIKNFPSLFGDFRNVISMAGRFASAQNGASPIAFYNAADAIGVRWQTQTRIEWAESMARSLAILRDLERRRTADYDLLDEALDGYGDLIRLRSEGRWREFSDGVERWLDQAIDAHVSHARRWSRLNAKDGKAIEKLDKDARAAGIFAKMMVGHNPAEIRGEMQKAGLVLRDTASMMMLGRQVFAQAPEVARTLKAATTVGAARSIRYVLPSIRGDLVRMVRNGEDLGALLGQVESIAEGVDTHISRRLDPMPDSLEQGMIPDPTMTDRVGTWIKVKGRGMIFSASLGKAGNDITGVMSSLLANERMTLDIPKAQRVMQRIANGEEVVAATKAEKIGYPEYQHIRRYLSEDSLNRMASIFEDGSKETIRNSKGREVVEIWAPRDATDEAAISEYAMLISRYADRQIRFVPQASDSFIVGDPQGVISNWVTQFLKPTIAGSNALVLARANAGVMNRMVEMSTVAFLSFLGVYLRHTVSGRGEQFYEEAQTFNGLFSHVWESLGYSGVIGWLPDRFGAAGHALFFGEDKFRSRGSVEYAVDTPVQSFIKRSAQGAKGLLTGDPTPSETMYIRRWLSAGILDTTVAHAIRMGLDATGLDEALSIDEMLDAIYPEAKD
jgi:hypothetical protein